MEQSIKEIALRVKYEEQGLIFDKINTQPHKYIERISLSINETHWVDSPIII